MLSEMSGMKSLKRQVNENLLEDINVVHRCFLGLGVFGVLETKHRSLSLRRIDVTSAELEPVCLSCLLGGLCKGGCQCGCSL